MGRDSGVREGLAGAMDSGRGAKGVRCCLLRGLDRVDGEWVEPGYVCGILLPALRRRIWGGGESAEGRCGAVAVQRLGTFGEGRQVQIRV